MKMKRASSYVYQVAITFIISALVLYFTSMLVKAETTNNETVTFTGYLIDEHCFEHKSDEPGKDTKKCLLMDNCIKGGYGIAVPQLSGSYKFYYFNGKFFTDVKALDGTDGQKLAYDIINSSKKEDHLVVTATGVVDSETKTSIALQGVSYQVINVTNLVEASEKEVANLTNTTNSTNVQNEKKSEGNKCGECIPINYIVIILGVIIVLAVAIILILKKIRRAK